MSHRRAPFRQIDVTRALRAAKAAGIDVGRFEIDPQGKLVIIAKDEAEATPVSLLEAWKASRARPS